MKNYLIVSLIVLNSVLSSLKACDYQLIIYDSYGDGWNGASLDIDFNGTYAGTATLDDIVDDGSSATWNLTGLNTGDAIGLTFFSGTWDSECSWELYDADGILVCAGSPSTTTCSGTIVDCNDVPPPITYVTGCGGTFTDLGGAANYGNNENQSWVFCPDVAGTFISLNFTQWAVENGTNDDQMIIYDGDDNTAPLLAIGDGLNSLMGIVQPTAANTTGCLTFEWSSDGDGTVGAGWSAAISCVVGCQTTQVSLLTSTPSASGGYIDICPGETINFSGTGIYENDGSYPQSDATSTFQWDFGDGTTATGQNVSHTYPIAGGYDVNLVITDVNNCVSTNDLGLRVRVSTTPNFAGTIAATDPVCLGSCSQLTGVPNMTQWSTPPGQTLAGTTFLPDGTGVSYTTSLNFDNFTPGATVTAISDIVDLCINMEHSYIGDLIVTIACPNGQTTTLFDGNNASSLSEFLGVPIDNDANTAPGVGWDYCFTMSAAIDITGTGTASGASIPAGDYTPEGTWADLIGCPLNGDWTINILDDQGSDNGYIFSWGLSFDPSLYPDGWGFTPTVVSQSWSGTTVTAGNPTTACPPDLGAENYTFTIVDNFGCSYDTTISITAVGIAIDTASFNPTCAGACDGSISITNPTGGTAPFVYSYAWSGGNAAGQTTATAVGLCAGNYTVTVSESGITCTNVQTFTLVDPPALTMTLTPTDESCGSSDGTITVSVSGAAAPVDYVWQVTAGAGTTNGSINNQANPYVISGLQTSTYSVTATDNNGCQVIGSVTVGTTGSVVAGFSCSANQCLEGNSFNFTNTSTTTTGITYDVTAPAGGTSAAGLVGTPNYNGFVADASGVWTVVQTITNGSCTDTQLLTFTVYNEPILSLVGTDLTCNQSNTGSGTLDGSITASVTNSNGSDVFTIISGSGSFTGNLASGLTSNTYDVVLVDAFGCNDTSTVTLTEPAAIVLNLTSTNNSCNGAPCNGTANVASVTGGVGPFTYNWGAYGTSQNISNLCVGTYNVTVYDSNSPANGCYEVGSQTISEPPAETYSPSSLDATCGLATGTATITVTTAPASATYQYTWFDDAALTNQIGFTAASASTSDSVSAVAAGTYYVSVQNANGCTDVIPVTVNDNGSPTLTVTSSTDLLCNGVNIGQITVGISGTLNPNFTYTWDDGFGPVSGAPTSSTTDQQTGLSGGTYAITVTDAAGCQATASVVIAEPTLMTGNIIIEDANCSTLGSLTVNAANGTTATPGVYDYQWDNDGTADPATDSQTIVVATGLYNVTVYDDNNCELHLSATVNDIGGIDADTTINAHALCNGSNEGSITANPIGGTASYSYAWTPNTFTNPNAATYSGLPAGTYTCVVTDVNGCSAVTSATISEPTIVVAGISDSTMVSCFNGSDGSITAFGTGGTGAYTYDWSPNGFTGDSTDTYSNLQDGCYTVTVRDVNLCWDDTTVCIHEPSPLVISVNEYDAHCDQADGSASVNISGGTAPYPTINWSAGIATASPDSITGLAYGTYSVTVFDNNGCSQSAFFNIDSISRGIITISDFDNVSCNGFTDGTIEVSVGGGGGTNNYLWDNAIGNVGTSTTINGLSANTYNVTATDIWGCELYAQQIISEPTPLTLTINHLDDRCNGTCEGSADAIVGGGTSTYQYQWDNSTLSTTSTINNLCDGWYSVTVEDAHNCIITDSVEILEPAPISLIAVIDSSSCGQSDGNITVSPVNGVGPFTYTWNPNPVSSTVDSLIGIPQGTYWVTVTDSKLCPFDSSFVVVDQNSPTAQIDVADDPSCNGSNNGSVTASAIGGVLPYTWAWSSDSLNLVGNPLYQSNVANNLDGGNVCVTVTDVNGCQSTACTFLVENPPLNVVISTVDVLCNGDSTGSASAVVTGGTGLGTYSYAWNGPASGLTPTDANNSGMPSGTYNLLVTDANGCTVLTNNIMINEPTPLLTTFSWTDVSCNGVCDGTATLIPTGGTGSGTYSYAWDDTNNQTSITATGLCASNYHPTLTDNNGCTTTTLITISEPTPLVIDSVVTQNISCFGNCSGSIVTYVSGGTLNYSYTYTDPSSGTYNTQGISSLCLPGTYDIQVVDGQGCEIDTSVIINQAPELVVTSTYEDESCYSYCDGSIDLTITGGTLGYTYTWSDVGLGTQDRIDLCPDTYNYTVTDANNCTVNNSITINGNPQLGISLSNSTNASCGNCDGTALVGINGGAGTLEVTWTGGNFSTCTPTTPFPSGIHNLNQTGLPQGIYTATVEDANGCESDVDVVINNLDGPVIDNVNVTDVLCHGIPTGTIDVIASGGTGTLTPSWDPGNTGSVLLAGSFNQASLYAGDYFVTVVDNNGCEVYDVITINENPELLVNIININDATCNGSADGSATIQGFGGTGFGTYTYNWTTIPPQGNVVTATGISAGTYIGSITDNNGCTNEAYFTIDEPNPITLANQIVDDISCAFPQICDGSIVVAATGGNNSSGIYNYNWFGNGANQNTVGGLCPGTVQLQVSDPLGCTGNFVFQIGQPDTIKVTLGQDPIACADPNGMIWIQTITGGTASTDYTNSYTNHQDNTYPLNGGWTCTWDVFATQSAYVNGVYNQYYQVQVFDPNNHQCYVTQGIQVGEVPEPYLFSQNTEPTTCNGLDDGKVRVQVKQGVMEYTYSWNLGNNVPFPTGSDTVLITNIPAGTYQLTVTDDNGCEVPTSFTISEPNPISVTASLVPNATICISQSAVVYANGAGGTPPYRYDWLNTPTSWTPQSGMMFSPANDTLVSVRIKDRNSCEASTQIIINVNDSLQIGVVPDGSICEGESYDLNVTYSNGGNGNYNYFWSYGNNQANGVITPTTTQTYYVTLTDNCGTPPVVESVTVVVNPNPYVQYISQRDSCEPLGMVFIPYPEDNNVHYLWNFGDPISGGANVSTDMYPSHLFQNAGVYDITLHLSSNENCIYDTIFQNWIEVYPLPVADFGMDPNPASLFNNTVTFTDLTESEDAIDNIQWDFGNGEHGSYLFLGSQPKSSYENPGYVDIVLFAETRHHCKDTVTKVLRINDEYTLYIPNAFSPGQDGRNDYFYPMGHGIAKEKDYIFIIYDRWGIEIYNSKDVPYGIDKKCEDFNPDYLPENKRGWNGKYHNTGEYVQNDVYSWYLKLIDVNGVSHEKTGKVTIIR